MSKPKGEIVFEWNGFKIKKVVQKGNNILYKLMYIEVDKKGNSKQIILDFPSLKDAKAKYEEIRANGN